jgi:adenosylcobinamide amidohydrolase
VGVISETEPVRSGGPGAAVCIWQFAEPQRVIASASIGGGIGARDWIINAQVPLDYSRTDLEVHIVEIANAYGCRGAGVGMLTAANVDRTQRGEDGPVVAFASVGLTKPTWAADAAGAISDWTPGTINVVAFMAEPLTDDALVNAVMTATEAKTQALVEAKVAATGTASDAVCIACSMAGPRERFAGPRSRLGAPLARAVHAAVAAGVAVLA